MEVLYYSSTIVDSYNWLSKHFTVATTSVRSLFIADAVAVCVYTQQKMQELSMTHQYLKCWVDVFRTIVPTL